MSVIARDPKRAVSSLNNYYNGAFFVLQEHFPYFPVRNRLFTELSPNGGRCSSHYVRFLRGAYRAALFFPARHRERQAQHVCRTRLAQDAGALGERRAGCEHVVDEQEALTADLLRMHGLVHAEDVRAALGRIRKAGLGGVVHGLAQRLLRGDMPVDAHARREQARLVITAFTQALAADGYPM